jgi:hypothetical protein
VIINEKECWNLKYVSIKFVQIYLQKCLTWPKKVGKCRQEWNKPYEDSNIHPRKKTFQLKKVNFFT